MTKMTKPHRLAKVLGFNPAPGIRNDHAAELKRKHGVSEEQYLDTLSEQGGGCAICGKSPKWDGKAHALDHDHATGKIRGILCRNCNTGIGQFHDSIELLARAIQYLNRYK